MLRTRVIPCLLVSDGALVKTIRFKELSYIGDPVNAVRIFDEYEVDELLVLDISASRQGRSPDFGLVRELASQCFMPLAYGGGIATLDDCKRILEMGVEKVVVNTQCFLNPGLLNQAARIYGAQSVVASIDVKRTFFGAYRAIAPRGWGARGGLSLDPPTLARQLVEAGAGEIFLNSVDRDGTMSSYDTDLIRSVADSVNVPVVACGGAGSISDFGKAVREGKAAAVAAGSLFVYQNKLRSVLIHFPSPAELREALGDR